MAGRPFRDGADQKRIAVAVGHDFHQTEIIARRLAFVPQFGSAPAPEPYIAGLHGTGQRLGAHEAQHQHRTVPRVLHHGGNQAPIVESDSLG
jgi:hypothetical protein